MKYSALIIFLGIFSSLLAQRPKVFLSEEQVKKYEIEKLYVVLDEAAKGYQLSFDTLSYHTYLDNGKIQERIGFRSDACYIQDRVQYFYYPDSTVIIRVDSTMNCIDFLSSVDSMMTIQWLEDEKVYKEAYYPKANSKRLKWARYYGYFPDGRMKRQTTIHQPKEIKQDHITVNQRLQSVSQYIYDKKRRLIKVVTKSDRSNGEREEVIVNYEYQKRTRIYTQNRTSIFGEEINIREETDYDKKGRIIEERSYNREGEVYARTRYFYDKRGLLIKEEDYDQTGRLNYRFVSYYQTKR